jgi:hypothetical protein
MLQHNQWWDLPILILREYNYTSKSKEVVFLMANDETVMSPYITRNDEWLRWQELAANLPDLTDQPDGNWMWGSLNYLKLTQLHCIICDCQQIIQI